MTCTLCNSLQGVGPLLSENEVRLLPRRPTRIFRRKDILWPNLVKSANICYCCGILLKGITGCLQQHQLQPNRVMKVQFDFLYRGREEGIRDYDKDVTCELEGGSTFKIEFFTLEDDRYPCPHAWDDVPISKRTSAETSSEEAFKKAHQWLQYCNDEYHGCEVPEGEDPLEWVSYCAPIRPALPPSAQLPTRVVNVGRHDGKIRLVEGNGEVHKYICLSHCWGPKQIITTTTSTLIQRMHEINPEHLSKTFKEAIWVTRRFGIDFIWIDSLCIIQDDTADWERESAQMASIYHNAYLTIAATKSSDGDGGLFTETPDFEVSGTTPAGEDYYLVFRERIDHELSVSDAVSEFPLLKRAWVYQERMLSPRVLHFGHYELFFECSSESYCECGNIGFLGDTEDVPLPNPRHMYTAALESVAPTCSGWTNRAWIQQARYFIARVWRSLVMIYTALSLTVESDRLPALSGVARTFAEKRDTLYLAGLFRDSLLDDLLWVTPQGKKPRLSKWRAPSWSWASIETHVDYRDGLVYYDDEVFSEKPDERIEFASIDRCTCVAASDGFGKAESASLRITSQFLQAVLIRETDHDHFQRPKYCVRIGDGDGVGIPRIWLDYDLSHDGPYQVLPGTEVYCLRMIQKLKYKIDISLILRAFPTDTGSSFERIGILQLDPQTPKNDGLEPETRDLVFAALDKAEVRTVDIM